MEEPRSMMTRSIRPPPSMHSIARNPSQDVYDLPPVVLLANSVALLFPAPVAVAAANEEVPAVAVRCCVDADDACDDDRTSVASQWIRKKIGRSNRSLHKTS